MQEEPEVKRCAKKRVQTPQIRSGKPEILFGFSGNVTSKSRYLCASTPFNDISLSKVAMDGLEPELGSATDNLNNQVFFLPIPLWSF